MLKTTSRDVGWRSLIAVLPLLCAVFAQTQPHSAKSPLTAVADIPLPGPAARFDYQSLDPTTGHLYIAHMNADHLVVFDTTTRKYSPTSVDSRVSMASGPCPRSSGFLPRSPATPKWLLLTPKHCAPSRKFAQSPIPMASPTLLAWALGQDEAQRAPASSAAPRMVVAQTLIQSTG